MMTITWLLLVGELMLPSEQDISIAARIAEQFLAQTTDRLIIIIVALFVIFLILGALVTLYLLRNMGGRDKTTNTVVTQLSLIIAQQNKTLEHQDRVIEKRDSEYRAQLKDVSERNTRADILHSQAAATLKEVTAFTDQRLLELQKTQIQTIDTLSGHDERAASWVKDIINAVQRVEVKVDDALKGIGEIKAFYPEGSDRMARIERELEEAIEALRDCAKTATDEQPVVDALALAKVVPETEEDLTPGKTTDTEEAAA